MSAGIEHGSYSELQNRCGAGLHSLLVPIPAKSDRALETWDDSSEAKDIYIACQDISVVFIFSYIDRNEHERKIYSLISAAML